MKKLIPLLFAAFLTACSSMIPYKNQNLDYLHDMEQNPDAYRGKVVSFGGKVKGVSEDARRARLIIKIDVPLYYYATGKDPLSYELLLISFDKKGMPQMTGIQKGSEVKVLARAANYETRKNLTGKPIAVLHLIAFALADRTRNKDFFRPEPPYKQLYESWKAGKLFFKEQPQEIEAKFPAIQRKTMTFFPLPPAGKAEPAPAEKPQGIVYDEEEPTFVLPPDPEPVKPAQTESAKTNATQAGETLTEETALPADNPPATQEAALPEEETLPKAAAPAEEIMETTTLTEPAVPAEETTPETVLPKETVVPAPETTPQNAIPQETVAEDNPPLQDSHNTASETVR